MVVATGLMRARKSQTSVIKGKLKRRSAGEPIIGHMESDRHSAAVHLKGSESHAESEVSATLRRALADDSHLPRSGRGSGGPSVTPASSFEIPMICSSEKRLCFPLSFVVVQHELHWIKPVGKVTPSLPTDGERLCYKLVR